MACLRLQHVGFCRAQAVSSLSLPELQAHAGRHLNAIILLAHVVPGIPILYEPSGCGLPVVSSRCRRKRCTCKRPHRRLQCRGRATMMWTVEPRRQSSLIRPCYAALPQPPILVKWGLQRTLQASSWRACRLRWCASRSELPSKQHSYGFSEWLLLSGACTPLSASTWFRHLLSHRLSTLKGHNTSHCSVRMSAPEVHRRRCMLLLWSQI